MALLCQYNYTRDAVIETIDAWTTE